MPIYEYFCKVCDTAHEVSQRITDSPITACPACHSKKILKLISRSSFQLKGSGWYMTDYKAKAASPSNGNGKAHEEKPASPAPSESADSAKKSEPAKTASTDTST